MKYQEPNLEEREVYKDLTLELLNAFHNALEEGLHWSNLLGLTIYHVSKFSQIKGGAETTEIATMALYSLCLSTCDHDDEGRFDKLRKQYSVEISVPDHIGENIDEAAAIILAAFEDLFEDLCGMKNSQKATRH